MTKMLKFLKQNIWLIGVLLGVVSWFFDAFVDYLFFSHDPLVETLLFPSPSEIWMRSLNIFILVVFGLIVQFGWNRQNKIQEDLRLSQEQGRQCLNQFRAILDGTSQHTGENFFSSMVKHLASTLNVHYAFIGNLIEQRTKMQSLAFVSDGKLLDTMTYELDGTPCGNISEKSQCLYNGDVQSKFPKDVYLKENDIKSYLGVSLVDMNGSPLGIMSIMDTKLLDENEIENMQSTLRAFAARVEAEMRRIKVENKMQHYANKLEQSNQDLQDFAYIASHDLKEPLRKINILGEMLEESLETFNDKQKKIITHMINGANRMNYLVDDLLQLGLIKTKPTTLVELDLNKVVSAALEELDLQIIETNARIDVEDLPTLKVDKVYIQQLFNNLIGNAIKYKDPSHSPIITICAKKNLQNIWEFKIADNGIGFDEKYAEKIFKPFERLHNHETYGGTGMGLSICKKIIERHNGTLTAKSSIGNGTTFTFTIPQE